MDRRHFLKGAAAVSLLPILPAVALPEPVKKFGATSVVLDGAPDGTPGEWHHFAMTKEATDFKFYVDGELVAENLMIEPQMHRREIWKQLSEGLRQHPDSNTASIWVRETNTPEPH